VEASYVTAATVGRVAEGVADQGAGRVDHAAKGTDAVPGRQKRFRSPLLEDREEVAETLS
jgi:hypothetical protein